MVGMKIFKEEVAKQKEERRKRRAAFKPKKFFSSLFFITFYTVLFFLFAYVVILFATTVLPMILAGILAGLGYTLANLAEVVLAGCVALFLTAWFFTLTFLLVKKVFGIYWRGVKKRLPEKRVADMNETEKEQVEKDLNLKQDIHLLNTPKGKKKRSSV